MKLVQRILVALVVLSLVLAAIAGIHYYTALRLFIDPLWSDAAPTSIAALVMSVGMSLMLTALLSERFLKPPLCRFFTWPGYLWMGLVLLLFLAVCASDLLLLATGFWGELARERAGFVIGLCVSATGLGVYHAMSPPPLREVSITLSNWPKALDGFCFVQITDLHLGPILGRAWATRIVERVQARAPDCILITGDLIDGFVSRMASETLPLAELSAPHGVYVITGNHEMFNGVRGWMRHYTETLGLRLLANERITLGTPDACFDLAGTHDRTGTFFGQAEDLDPVFEDREDPERPLILLAHDPLTFKRAAARGVDLQISGHTHGAQIWPLHPIVKAVIPWLAGHYQLGESQIYVSRGTGFWGPPLRLGAPPEITEIRIYGPGAICPPH